MRIILGARCTRKHTVHMHTPRARRSYRSPLTVSWLNRYLTPETWGSMLEYKKKKMGGSVLLPNRAAYSNGLLRMAWNYQRDNNIDDLELVRRTEK